MISLTQVMVMVGVAAILEVAFAAPILIISRALAQELSASDRRRTALLEFAYLLGLKR